MYIPLIGYLLYRVVVMYEISRGKVSVIFLGGMVFWTFFEYMAHRFLFHLHSERRFWQRIGYIMHGNHHEFPKDKTRLFMPQLPVYYYQPPSLVYVIWFLERSFGFSWFLL